MTDGPEERPLDDLIDELTGADAEETTERIQTLHPATIADVLESLPVDQRLALWRAALPQAQGEVLLELHEEAREALIGEAEESKLVDAIVELQADEIADLDEHLPAAVLWQLEARLGDARRDALHQVRDYPDDCAGGLMDVDAVSIRANVTLAVVLRYLRHRRHSEAGVPEHLDAIFVTDEHDRLVGTLPLADLVSRDPALTVGEVMSTEESWLAVSAPATEVARLFEDRDLLSAPVVDDDGRLVGRITVDDVIDVIREAGDKLALRPAGLDEEADLFASVGRSVRRRSIWLLVNLVNAFFAAWVIGLFETSIQAIVALAVLMPVVASMGGVAGQQSLALVIRALALGQVSRSNLAALAGKEALVGLTHGLVFAALVAGAATLWFGDASLALVFGLAMIFSLLLGTLLGALLPVAIRALGVDPALAGGVALTATTDVVGFASFLGLATLLLLA